MNNPHSPAEVAAKVSGLIIGAVEGTVLSAAERDFFSRYPLAGVTLFRRNIPKAFAELRTLCDALAELSDASPIIAIDQEGGRVRRITAPFPDIGPNLTAFADREAKDALPFARNYGLMSALCLSGLGINVNFAPVVDIFVAGADASIGDRCFSAAPEDVTALAAAYADGLHEGGVASCLKHFPGQGRGTADTHHTATVIAASSEELALDLSPFARLAPAVPLVMISHAVYPAYDPDHKASCSKPIIEGILREQLGFEGVVLSDDVNMKAFDESPTLYAENIIASIKAGVDGLLVCEGLANIQRTITAITAAIDGGDDELARRVEESYQRLLMFRASLAPV